MEIPHYIPSEMRSWLASVEKDDCLRRLVEDDRMREVYRILNAQQFGGHRVWRFICAGWVADMDYTKERDNLDWAVSGTEDTLKYAKSLREKLLRLERVGYGQGIHQEWLANIEDLISKVGSLIDMKNLKGAAVAAALMQPERVHDNRNSAYVRGYIGVLGYLDIMIDNNELRRAASIVCAVAVGEGRPCDFSQKIKKLLRLQL